jgi:hypothetical protein
MAAPSGRATALCRWIWPALFPGLALVPASLSADQAWAQPSFFGYMICSGIILIPLLVVKLVIFFS